MNKWFLRLVGVLILGVLAILFYDLWFRPTVPDVLQDDIHLEVRDQPRNPNHNQSTSNNQSNAQGTNVPPAPQIELTSLEDQNEPAVLSNPDSRPKPTQTTEPVVVTKKTSQQKPQPPIQSDVVQGSTWVQVGSFADSENAQKMVSQMKERNWPTDTEVANVNGKSYHRVFVGPLSSSDVAKYLKILGDMGINAREVTRN